MVSLPLVESSNALISSTLPGPLTAIFVGGTKGIGAHTLRAFARHTAALAPTVYLIARSPAAGAAVVAECRALCPSGTFVFMPADVGLMREVDRVCAEIAARERSVNVVFMSQGSFDLYARTDEGLGVMGSLAYYSRVRFARQLLPLLQRAEGLRRVVNVFTGTKEGPLDQEDIDCLRLKGPSGIMKARGHAASLLTLGLECLAQEAPDVGFVHNFPGFVNTDLGDTMPGLMGVAMRAMGRLVGTWKALSGHEVGERHVFLLTSRRFAGNRKDGVALEGVDMAEGTDGKTGSGMYSVNEQGEPGDTQKLLEGMRQDGTRKKVWEHTLSEWDGIFKA